MKKVLRNLMGSALVRWPVLAVMKIIEGFSRLASVLRTAALFPGANRPICHWSVQVKNPEGISFGKGVIIGPNCVLGGSGGITFADGVRLSEGVVVETASLDLGGDPPYVHKMKPIVIGEGVWLCTRCIVLGGVTIGRRAVIGAGAVADRDVPERGVVRQRPGAAQANPKVCAPI